MSETPVQVLMVNGRDLDRIAADEATLFALVTARSEELRRLRTGDPPWMIFQELDSVRDWLLTEKPDVRDLWLYLERRDFNTTLTLVAAILHAWLESQRATSGFDEGYMKRVQSQRIGGLPA